MVRPPANGASTALLRRRIWHPRGRVANGSAGRLPTLLRSPLPYSGWCGVCTDGTCTAIGGRQRPRPALVTAEVRSIYSETIPARDTPPTSSADDGAAPDRGLLRLLTDEQRDFLEERQSFVQRARDVAARIPGLEVQDCSVGGGFLADVLPSSGVADDADREAGVVDSTFAVVVAGEFNAGKSTLINALLGQRLLEAGALPTTDEVIVLAADSDNKGYASGNIDGGVSTIRRGGVALHRIPSSSVPLLRDLTIIDTPGTNSVVADHTARTLKLLPEADLLLFVTSADRPFPESERTLLKSIQGYRKSIVIVINKMDVLEASGGSHGEREKVRVTEFVRDAAADLLGASPVVLPISARDALSAKITSPVQSGDSGGAAIPEYENSSLYGRSNFVSLEDFLRTSLTSERRVKSKLLNPVGVAEGMLDQCLTVLADRAKELESDVATLNLLEGQMDGWTTDTDRMLEEWIEDVSDVLRREGKRVEVLVGGMKYIDMWRWSVLDSTGERFMTEWTTAGSGSAEISKSDGSETSMSSSSPVEAYLLRLSYSLSESLHSRAVSQGRAVVEYLGRRPAVRANELLGTVAAVSDFGGVREELRDRTTAAARAALAGYDPAEERERVRGHLRTTALLSGATATAAFGLGGASALEVVDIFAGATSSASLAALGMALVPFRHGRLVGALSKEWDARRTTLHAALVDVLGGEVRRIRSRVEEGVGPYARYVRTERDDVRMLQEKCEELVSEGHALRGRINRIGK